MQDTLVSLRNADLGYDGRPVLSGVTVEIREGDRIGIVGPNGTGKTTLLRAILGLLEPLSGEVRISPGAAGRTGYVPQGSRLDPIHPLTAYDVVRLGVRGALPWGPAGAREAGRRALECLDIVEMLAHRDKPFQELSGGQLQRILVARALAVHPRLLVLDEPTTGIDSDAREKIARVLTQMNERENIAVVIVSHYVEDVRLVATETWTIRDGRLIRPEAP